MIELISFETAFNFCFIATVVAPLCPEAEPVVAPLPVLPKTAPRVTAKPTRRSFGIEDVKRIRLSVAKKRIGPDSTEEDVDAAWLFGSETVLAIVLRDYRESPVKADLFDEIRRGLIELLGEAAGRERYRDMKRAIKRDLATPTKPAFEPAVLVAPAPEREPMVEPSELEQLLNAASPSTIEQVAARVVGIAKGDTRYELKVSASLKQLARQKFVAALISARVSPEEALRRGDELVFRAQPIFPKKVAPKPETPAADVKPLSTEELAALFDKSETVAPEAETIEPARVSETRLAKPKPAAKIDEAERAARAERQAAKEARARLMAADLKAGAMPPRAPKPPKAKKDRSKKARQRGE